VRWIGYVMGCVSFGALLWWQLAGAGNEARYEEVTIAPGVTYSQFRLPETANGGGMVWMVSADLGRADVDLVVSKPLPTASPGGVDYQIRHVWEQVAVRGLVAGVNGTFFKSRFIELPKGNLYLPRQDGSMNYTAVADDRILRQLHNPCLIWFDQQGVAHATKLKQRKIDPDGVMDQAKILFGAWRFIVTDGKPLHPRDAVGPTPNRSTVLGIDDQRQRVWLAVFERANEHSIGPVLAETGVRYAIPLDGGGSSCLAIAPHGKPAPSGTVFGGMRPVAQTVGIVVDGGANDDVSR